MIKFGGADHASIDMLSSFRKGFYISELVDNRSLEIRNFLRKHYLENGAALFGSESSEEFQDFRDVCNSSLDKLPDSAVYEIVQFFVQRMRNYAHLGSLKEARIVSARIVCQSKPRTPICRHYENTLISVNDCWAKVEELTRMEPEEQGVIINTTDLGFPPLYRRCRCRLEGLIRGIDY